MEACSVTEGNLEKLAHAIAKEEGFFDPIGPDGPNRPQRNHNCGDLRNWPGYPTDAGGFSIFPDDETGWAKLREDIEHHAARFPSQTLPVFISGDGKPDGWPGYAPASDHNDPAAYGAALCRAVGCTPATTFEEL